jgi:dienelactone hydrolase
MKKSLIALTFFFQTLFMMSQVSLKEINLDYGLHTVGFKHYITTDQTRTYQRKMDWNTQSIPRPISISLWFPAIKNETSKRVSVLNYMRILKQEDEWDFLPDDQLLNWFAYHNTPENKKHLAEETAAFLNTNLVRKKFPVVIYAASLEASSIENFAICEYLASHGYVVISTSSKGTEGRWTGKNSIKEIETQTRDLEFLLQEIHTMKNVDTEKIATMAFSFGGLSNVLLQMKNKDIKAIVSLDGTIRYNYEALKKSAYEDINKVNVPFIHMAQKKIPEDIIKSDKINPELNSKFEFYDKLVYSDAYKLRFHDLTHFNFSSLDILLRKRDARQDKSDEKIMKSYRLVSEYSLQFLNGYLKDDTQGIAFLKQSVSSELLSKEYKVAKKIPFNFRNFHELAKNQNYKNLLSLYDSAQKEHSEFKIQEGQLNQLGLQLIFNPKTSQYGIQVFIFATKLYPKSSNLFDSLAEAYLFINNKKKAILNFKKSLELYSGNQNAISRLKELE